MFRFLPIFFVLLTSAVAPAAESGLRILVVVGAEGTEEYGEAFLESAALWQVAARKGDAELTLVGGRQTASEKSPEKTDVEKVREAIAGTKEPELWIVLIGHGSFDTREVKFNLRGPDFTDAELAEWVEAYPGELAVINTASASGSFIRRLSAPGRVVITATKNEAEVFYTRFGKHFAEAVGGAGDADLDNDEQVSLLECFLYAANRVEKFYETEGRLATEHALLDDNGDEIGSRSEWFEGTTAIQTASKDAEPDGERAAQKVLVKNEFERRLSPKQRIRRDELERDVKQLRRKKDDVPEDEYYEQLERLLLELARLYREVADS